MQDLVKPNGSRVFIKKIDRATQTSSGLYLGIDPSKAKIENMGVILAIGNDILAKEYCKVGVKVCFDEVLEMDLTIEDEDFVVLDEKNIVCYFYDGEPDEV